MSKDYYNILGVLKTASQEEIKKAFRKLAHQHHPDKGNGDDKKFKEINEAYQTLGNEEKRKQYDQFGQTFGSAGPGGFSYQDFSRASAKGGPASGWDFGGFEDLGDLFGGSDIFSSFFSAAGGPAFGGGRSRKSRTARGSDLEIELAVDFEEAVFGAEKTIDLQKQVVCQRCGGAGAEPGAKIIDCKTCNGRGHISRVQQTILGTFQTQSVCPDCQGEGKKPDKKCSDCGGKGVVYGSEKIKVKIPAGIENGQSLKLSGKGESASKGVSGDLYINIKIRPSHQFKRAGNNILSTIHISLRQAIFGDKIQAATVDGPVSLKIPEGTQSHTQFKLNSKGVPHLRSRGRGDQIVEVVVDIPKNLSRKQRKMLEELNI